MKNTLFEMGLYFIIDGMYTDDFEAYTRIAVRNNISIIQYRDKKADSKSMICNASNMQKITFGTNTCFIVNDIPEVALNSDADGIHVGQSDENYLNVRNMMPNKIIGVSTMTLEESLEAEKLGADYIGVGPIFVTQTKPNTPPPIGLERLQEIVEKTSIPIVAIGGITLDNLESILQTGVHGVAIISAIMTAPDPEKEIEKIQRIIKKYKSR